jgi:hypothetical protein
LSWAGVHCKHSKQATGIGVETGIDELMNRLSPNLNSLDEILRYGDNTYSEHYSIEAKLDHDASTQAHCTHRHIMAEAHRKLDDLPLISSLSISSTELWFFEELNIILRFKKTDKYGKSSNYQTDWQKSYDRGEELQGLPQQPTRLTAGYVLDDFGVNYVRSQIVLPSIKKGAIWCAAINPEEDGAWEDVSSNHNLRFG